MPQQPGRSQASSSQPNHSQAAWDPTLGDPVQPASRVLTLNVSRIRDFQRCRRMFFLRWVLRLAGEAADDTDASWIGSTTHEALHALHQKGTTAQHVVVDATPDSVTGAGEMLESVTGIDEMLATDPRVGTLIRTHMIICPNENAEYLGGELDARWLIARKSVLLTGRFDAVWRYPDGTIEVRDYKTGRCPDSLDGDLGAAIYLLLAANLEEARTSAGELRPIRVVYENLAAPEGRLVAVDASRSLLRDAFNEVVALAEHIRKEKTFPANPSSANCRSCSYRNSCPYSEAKNE